MKIKLATVFVGAALLAGCVVDSEQPFYQAGDLIFDKRLVGDWRVPPKPDEKPDEAIRIQRDGAKGYLIRQEEADGKAQVIELRLFKLAGQIFMDSVVRPKDGSPQRHQLSKVEVLGDTWKFRGLNYSWVHDYLRKHPDALAHRFDQEGNKDKPPVTLTATTAQLQAFVVKHQAEPGFFGEPSVLERVKPIPSPKGR